jgi:hypothetical protein
MRNILITSLGLAVTAAIALGSVTPAAAAESGDRCAAEAQQIRAAIAGADAAVAQNATRRLHLGEQLCRANNPRAGMKELKVAQKLLGVESQPQAVAQR